MVTSEFVPGRLIAATTIGRSLFKVTRPTRDICCRLRNSTLEMLATYLTHLLDVSQKSRRESRLDFTRSIAQIGGAVRISRMDG